MRRLLMTVTLLCLVAAVPTGAAAEEKPAQAKDPAPAENKEAPKAPAAAPEDEKTTARRAQLERTVRAADAEIAKAKEELLAYDDKVQQLRIKGKVTHRSDLKDETGRTLEDYESLMAEGQKKLKTLELAADTARLDLDELKKKTKSKE